MGACFDSGLALTAGVLYRSDWIRTCYFFQKKKLSLILRNMLHMHQLTGNEIFKRLSTFLSSNRLTINCHP